MRAKSKLAGILLLILFVQLSADAQHESQGYLPLTKAEIRKKFPVKYVGTLGYERPGYFEGMVDKPFPGKLDIGPSGAVVTEENDNDLIIAGKDRRNHDWSIEPGELVFAYACRFYEADLDRDGTRDALLVFPTGGNGLAPTSHLLAITFDERGLPVTFEADGYFQEVDGKIFDLVDLDQDRRAELIYMNFSDGYWITSLYEVRNGRWRKIHGRHGGRIYPLYTRFTFRENHKSTVPKPGRHPFAPDLSNTSPRLVGRLVSYEWANGARSEDILLRVTDKRGNAVSSKPESWSASFAVVVDNNKGRKILFLTAKSDSVKSLLNEIVANRYEIALYGQRRPHTSSPEIIWARPKGHH
ncbi:MAG TPA: hypothetical protein VF074_03540 [Pyrinomonadaceae bacterium]